MPDPGAWAVGLGTLTLINAGLAQGKGRRGPIATFLIVILGRGDR